jgi:hypothetical protein
MFSTGGRSKISDLGGFLPEETAPDGGVEEDLPDFHGRAPGHAGPGDVADLPSADFDRRAHFGPLRPGGDSKERDRTDARQGFPPKPEGADTEKIVSARQLGCRMAADREGKVFGVDALAVVGDGDEVLTAFLDPDLHACRARIERVFDEFANHGSGAFDHLARGDHVDDVLRQLEDFPHRSECPRARSIPPGRTRRKGRRFLG